VATGSAEASREARRAVELGIATALGAAAPERAVHLATVGDETGLDLLGVADRGGRQPHRRFVRGGSG
jgi:hypothetical protein